MGFATERERRAGGRRFDVLLECSGRPASWAGNGAGCGLPAGAAMIGMSKEEAIGLPLSQLNPSTS